jgi:hypothetical protein
MHLADTKCEFWLLEKASPKIHNHEGAKSEMQLTWFVTTLAKFVDLLDDCSVYNSGHMGFQA